MERSCGTEAVGPDICSTQYETNCETRYNTYEIEQDEPVCVMELMKKCKNVTGKNEQTKLTNGRMVWLMGDVYFDQLSGAGHTRKLN